MKMISIFNSTIPNQLCKERLIPLLSFIIGMKKWIGAAVVLLSECRQKAILPRRGRIALSANERIAEFLDFAIQAKFAYVNKLSPALKSRAFLFEIRFSCCRWEKTDLGSLQQQKSASSAK